MVFKEQPLLFYALTPTVLTVSRLWMLEAVCLVVRAQPRVCSAPEICKIEGMSQVTVLESIIQLWLLRPGFFRISPLPNDSENFYE